MSKNRTKLITFLVTCTLLLPFLGYFSAAYIENIFYEPLIAAFVWLLFMCISITALYFINRIASRHYEFVCLKPTVYLACSSTLFVAGWIINGAWYDYYFFSTDIQTDFYISQHSDYPNHFIFDGEIAKNAGTLTVRYILNSENIELDKPIALEINSNGGSPQEAILISEFVEHYNIQVEVLGKCISACTSILLSSTSRYIHPRAWIGFHATYIKGSDNDISYDLPSLNYYDEKVEIALKKIGVHQEFINKSEIRDASGGFYPDFKELVNMGIVNRFKPTYIQANVKPEYL